MPAARVASASRFLPCCKRDVDLFEPLRVLARLRQQVRIVDRGDQREAENAQRHQADGARQPVVVEGRAAEADTHPTASLEAAIAV